MTHSERKKQLIAEGALHRADLLLAKSAVSAKTSRGALVGSALQQLKTSASEIAMRRIGNLSAADLQAVAPIALPLLTRLLEKKSLARTALGTAVAAGTAGYLFFRFKSPKAAAPNQVRETRRQESAGDLKA